MTDIKVKKCSFAYLYEEHLPPLKCLECNQNFTMESNLIIPQVNVGLKDSIWLPAYSYFHDHCFHKALKMMAFIGNSDKADEERKRNLLCNVTKTGGKDE